jgi:hypothetical protein
MHWLGYEAHLRTEFEVVNLGIVFCVICSADFTPHEHGFSINTWANVWESCKCMMAKLVTHAWCIWQLSNYRCTAIHWEGVMLQLSKLLKILT